MVYGWVHGFTTVGPKAPADWFGLDPNPSNELIRSLLLSIPPWTWRRWTGGQLISWAPWTHSPDHASSAAHGGERKMAKLSSEFTQELKCLYLRCDKLKWQFWFEPPQVSTTTSKSWNLRSYNETVTCISMQVSSTLNWPRILIGQAYQVDFTAFGNGINHNREEVPIITMVAVVAQC